MNTIRMLAWGMLDLNDKRLTKQQRRMYIQRIRKELKPYNLTLQVGGSIEDANYRLKRGIDHQACGTIDLAYHNRNYIKFGVNMEGFGRAILKEIEYVENTRRGNDAA